MGNSYHTQEFLFGVPGFKHWVNPTPVNPKGPHLLPATQAPYADHVL
jgi:hypothetical protein